MEHWHVVNDDGCPVGSGQRAAGRVVGTVVAKVGWYRELSLNCHPVKIVQSHCVYA